MRLLHRYLIFSMSLSYAICIAITFAFYVIIDLFAKFHRFVEHIDLVREAGGQPEELWMLLFRYYSCYSPLILYNLLPIITLMAAMFTVTAMARSNELTPLKACGVPIYCLFGPVLFLALLASLTMVFLQEAVIPNVADQIDDMERMERGRRLEFSNLMYCDENGLVFSIGAYFPLKMELRNVRVFEPYPAEDKDHSLQPQRIVEASLGRWGTIGGKNCIHLFEGTEDIYDSEGMLIRSKSLPTEGVRIQTLLRHSQLVRPDERHLDIVSTFRLWQMHADRPDSAMVSVNLHRHFCFPLSTVVMTLLGLPWILRQQTKNLFVGIVACVLVSGAFYGINLACVNAGHKEILNPVFAVWLPTVLFGSLGVSFLTIIHT